LAVALTGDGPALLPVPVGTEPPAVLGPLAPLGPTEDDPDDPTALVLATSGSTGEAKGVLLSAGQLAASAAATEDRLGGPGRWLLALPPWHIAGLQVLLRSLAAGEPPVALPVGPFRPETFTATADAMPEGRRYVSLVPTQLHRVLGDAAATTALAGFDAVLVGGAATAPHLLDQARAAGIAVVTTYGMTETCGGCVYDGRPLAGVTVAVDSADGTGRISLTGPMVARGYRGRPDDAAFPRPGTFVTGDEGTWRDEVLSVHGRADDVIVTGGLKVAPQLVEAVLAALPGVAGVVVVGMPDEQWGEIVTAVVQVRPGCDPTSVSASVLGVAALPAHQRPRRVLLIDAIPERGPGKPDRGAARAWASSSVQGRR
jgi:O-succinylbenzoic acid--CoA ligase